MASDLEISLLVAGEMQRSFPGNFSLSISPRLVGGDLYTFRRAAIKAKQPLLIDCRIAWFLTVTTD
jgi:hypothetical protein